MQFIGFEKSKPVTMKSINNFFGDNKLIKAGSLCKMLMFIVYVLLTSCSPSFIISKTNLPPSGGNYIFHQSVLLLQEQGLSKMEKVTKEKM